MKILFLFLMLSLPSINNEELIVDKVELNHVYHDVTHKHIRSQLILYKYLRVDGINGYRVCDYILVENDVKVYRDNDSYYFYHKHNNIYMKIRTKIYREYKSDFDVEIEDRKLLPVADRPSYIESFVKCLNQTLTND